MANKLCVRCGNIVPENHSCNLAPKSKTKSVNTTRRFQKIRKNIILPRDNYTCVRCAYFGRTWYGSSEDLECHHILGQSKYPKLAYKPDNLIMLCHECHDILDGTDKLDFPWTPPKIFEISF